MRPMRRIERAVGGLEATDGLGDRPEVVGAELVLEHPVVGGRDVGALDEAEESDGEFPPVALVEGHGRCRHARSIA
mgnify:CR=1 FL=1